MAVVDASLSVFQKISHINNKMGREGDFCDTACAYVYIQHHRNGCFSEVEETSALTWVKISCDHLGFCFHQSGMC